jgi:hypothetical protein
VLLPIRQLAGTSVAGNFREAFDADQPTVPRVAVRHSLTRSTIARSLSLLLVAAMPASLAAQSRSAVVAHVVDAESGAPLPGAQLRISALQQVARSDESGRAMLRRIPAGRVAIEVRRMGYLPASTEATLSGRDTLELEIALERAALAMDTVRVQAAAPALAPGLETFERRRERGVGHFIEPKALEAQGTREFATVVAERMPGVRAVYGNDGISRYLVSTRQRARDALLGRSPDDDKRTQGKLPKLACVMHVYLDGVFISDYDVSFIDTAGIMAVEVYQADAPAELRRPGSDCGVVVLWTKRSAEQQAASPAP